MSFKAVSANTRLYSYTDVYVYRHLLGGTIVAIILIADRRIRLASHPQISVCRVHVPLP